MSYREITAKRVIISLKVCFTLVSNKIYWQKRPNWALLMHLFAKIYKGKIGLKLEHFLLKIGYYKPNFCQNIGDSF